MKWLSENWLSIVVVIIVGIAFYFALKATIKSKGKCAYCEHRDTCPFKNKNIYKEIKR